MDSLEFEVVNNTAHFSGDSALLASDTAQTAPSTHQPARPAGASWPSS
ncbi:MAG: hypothetical protein P8Y02_00210 [Deinococcales bacterium]